MEIGPLVFWAVVLGTLTFFRLWRVRHEPLLKALLVGAAMGVAFGVGSLAVQAIAPRGVFGDSGYLIGYAVAIFLPIGIAVWLIARWILREGSGPNPS